MTKKLAQITRGETFRYGGHEWLVLEHRPTLINEAPDATLVLMADILEHRAFDTDNSADWRESSAREYLNDDFLEALREEAADGGDAIIEHTLSLRAEDGTFRETSLDYVRLLTSDEYREHRDVIKPIDEWWWLSTRYSASNSGNVRRVYTVGTLSNSSAYIGYYGLRPALLLDSDLSVSIKEDEQPEQESPAFGAADLNVLARAVRAVASHYGIDPDELARIATELGKAMAEVGSHE